MRPEAEAADQAIDAYSQALNHEGQAPQPDLANGPVDPAQVETGQSPAGHNLGDAHGGPDAREDAGEPHVDHSEGIHPAQSRPRWRKTSRQVAPDKFAAGRAPDEFLDRKATDPSCC